MTIEEDLSKKILNEALDKSKEVHIHIHCENFYIHVDQLSKMPLHFDFDKVEIKENSGSIGLNLNLIWKVK